MITYISPFKKYIQQPITNLQTQESFSELISMFGSRVYKEGSVVEGIVANISKNNVIIDIGMKADGCVPIKEFALLNPNGEITVKIGDIIKVFLVKIENKNGYANLSLEKAILEERWVQLNNQFTKKEVIEGIIFGKIKGGFNVDIGGVVAFLPGSQVDIKFTDINQLMKSKQQFLILKMDKENKNIVVSRRAMLEMSRNKIRNKLLCNISENDVVEGVIKNITNYGAFIDIGGIDGLLHVTDISWQRINHPSEILSIGEKLKVKIIKFDKEMQRISLGVKQLEQSPWSGIAEKYPVGSRHKGIITNITDYGAFVKLAENVEGLVYISEIAWNTMNTNPRELLSLNQEVETEILGIDEEKNRISLSIKRCINNPWISFVEKYSVGAIVSGTIKNVVNFGIFVHIDDTMIEGLINIDNVSWEEISIKDLHKFKKGQKIQTKILTLNIQEEKLLLGVKQVDEDPLEEALGTLQIGQIVTCTISEIKNNNVIVNISRGVDGIITKKEFAGEVDGEKATIPPLSTKITARITDIIKEERLIILSLKLTPKTEEEGTSEENKNNK